MKAKIIMKRKKRLMNEKNVSWKEYFKIEARFWNNSRKKKRKMKEKKNQEGKSKRKWEKKEKINEWK